MNKFLLLALMLLLGVLAFALGLFSKDSSTALSQYVPDSVGEMFSQTKSQATTSNTQQASNDHAEIAALVMPSQNTSASQQAASKHLEGNNLNTLKSSTQTSQGALLDIPAALIAEVQQELSPEASPEALASIKQSVNNVELENQALKEKLISLNQQSKESDAVLDELEQQFKTKLNTQKDLPAGRDDFLKELEKQIQNLNH